jgi:hypothetical protein
MRVFRHLDVTATIAAFASVIVVAALGLQEFAFSDYEVEVLPAAERLAASDFSGFVSRLPGYFGAVILQAPFGLAGGWLGGDVDLWTFRFQAIPGLFALGGLGAMLGSVVANAQEGTRGTLAGVASAVLVTGAPFAVRAETVGHPEELLVTALAVGAVWAGVYGRPAVAGVMVGLAATGKPWALVAVPVVLLAAKDRRHMARCLVAMAVAGALLAAPVFVAQGPRGSVGLVPTETGAVFKPAQVFWFFGPENPVTQAARSGEGTVYSTTTAPYADRLASDWAGRASHPLIILVAVVLAVGYRRRPRQPGLDADLILLLAAVCWWRCVLDTWNADYYALGSLVAMASWSAARGRVPVLATIVTAAAWITFRGSWSWWTLTPDIHTAIYLAWAVPLGIGLSWRALSPISWARVMTTGARHSSSPRPAAVVAD